MIIKSSMGPEGGEYPWDWTLQIPYQDLDDKIEDKILFLGWAFIQDKNNKYGPTFDRFKNIPIKYFINFSSPCELYDENFLEVLEKQKYFDKVFTICPLTVNYLNKYYNQQQFVSVPHPIPNVYLKKYNNILPNEKKYDVMFYGGIHSEEHHQIIKTFKGFKSCVVSYQRRNYLKWPLFIDFFRSATLEKKWDLLAESKILVGTNLLYLKDHEIDKLFNHKSFNFFPGSDLIKKEKILPQMKSRMLEAAATKTLMLLKKDQWNVIEHWYTPDKDFIYWENFKDLREKIYEISKGFDNYKYIVDNAFKTSSKYFFNEFSKQL